MDSLSTGVVQSVRLRAAGEVSRADEVLKATLNRFCPQRIGRIRGDILDAVTTASKAPASYGEASDTLLVHLEAADYRACDLNTWWVLTRVLIAHRFFECSGVTRDNARKVALYSATRPAADNDRGVLVEAVRASLDLGDVELACYFRNRAGPRVDTPAIDLYLSLCLGESARLTVDEETAGAAWSPDFERYVRGRSVALVGPAPCDAPQGGEIDGFDIIARITYWGGGHLPPIAERGSRTDVSYYNSAMGKILTEGPEQEFLNDLEFVVFKNSDHATPPARAAFVPHAVFFGGSPNMVPVAVYDLLQFAPSRLKLFGVTFFSSKQTHHSSYVAVPTAGATVPWSLAEHDLCAQVNFVRNLWRAGIVEADEAGSEVLAMDDRAYLRRMDGNYRPN